jgi:hypothetical protein
MCIYLFTYFYGSYRNSCELGTLLKVFSFLLSPPSLSLVWRVGEMCVLADGSSNAVCVHKARVVCHHMHITTHNWCDFYQREWMSLCYHIFFIDLYAVIMLISSCYFINMAQKKEQAGDSVEAHNEDDWWQFGSFVISITTGWQTREATRVSGCTTWQQEACWTLGASTKVTKMFGSWWITLCGDLVTHKRICCDF